MINVINHFQSREHIYRDVLLTGKVASMENTDIVEFHSWSYYSVKTFKTKALINKIKYILDLFS